MSELRSNSILDKVHKAQLKKAMQTAPSSTDLLTIATFCFTALAQAIEKPAIYFAGFNRKVRPRDDFFEFVNGQRLKDNPIPVNKTR
ncbi:MAG: hypothetical protein M2R45_05053 [Verrucomicrobia subdivision 3 bacterium]|nr:hypothetical protein [Limisphaerales bacterium]MCS1412544.1 hypothetical protein [Limisphaerales bacterium]